MLKNNNFVVPQLNGGNCNTPLENTKFNNSKDNLEFKDTPKVKKLFDYVSGTFTFNDLDLLHKLFKILGYDNHEIFFNQTYRQGYQNFYELGENIKVLMKGPKNKLDLQVNQLEMRGMGCRDFEMRNDKSNRIYYKLFKFLDDNNFKFNRIDITHDVFTDEYFTIEKLVEYINNGDYTSQLRDVEIKQKINGDGEVVNIIYFGSINSDCCICIYDKNAERIGKHDYDAVNSAIHYRIEVRLKHSRAEQFANNFIENETNSMQMISDYLYYLLDFKDPTDNDVNKSRRKTAKWWLDFLQISKKEKLSMQSKSSSLQVKKEWLRTSVARVLMLYYLAEPDFFENYLKILIIEAFNKFNEKDLVIINEYRDYFANKRLDMIDVRKLMESLSNGTVFK